MNEKNHLRKIIAVSLSAVMLCSAGMIMSPADCDSSFTVNAASAVSINSQDVKLYFPSTSFIAYGEESPVQMEDGFPMEFQLKVTGASKVTYKSNSSKFDVSEKGLVTLHKNYYRVSKSGSFTSYSPVDINNVTDFTNIMYRYEAGNSTITVTADSQTFEVKVSSLEYRIAYANKVMDDYIAKNITSSMTTEQKIDKIAAFVAGYNYDYHYQSIESMILYGGGDCWASTDGIITMAKKIGLRAWSRKEDKNSFVGHMNAMVTDGVNYYEVEAGYGGTAPRSYNITKRSCLFSTRYNSTYKGYEAYLYDDETMPEELTVVSDAAGVKVSGVGSYLTSNTDVKKVNLPEGLKFIGDSAFVSSHSLEEINLPASIEAIGEFAFNDCQELKKVTSKSSRFKASGTLIYDDVEKSVLFAQGMENAVVPSAMKELRGYSFYYNKKLKTVSIPSSIEKVGEAAFGACDLLEKVDIKNTKVTELPDFCFANCRSLSEVILPSGLVSIKDNVFQYCTSLKSVVIPSGVTSIGENVFKGCSSLETIYGYAGSCAETYAKDNNLNFIAVKEAASIKLSKSSLSLEKGKSYALNVTFDPSDTTDQTIKWKTSDSSVAAVKNGTVKAVSVGKAVITAVSANGKKSTCTVTVTEKLVNTSTISSTIAQTGDKIRVAASAKGGAGNYKYAYYFKRSSNTSWKVLGTEYGTDSSVSFTPSAAADYDVKVIVMDGNKTKSTLQFTVKVVDKLDLTNVSVLQRSDLKLGSAVPMIGKAVGGTAPYQYKFQFKRTSNTNWKTLGDGFSSVNTARLKPTASGSYDIRITVKDSKGITSVKQFTSTVK